MTLLRWRRYRAAGPAARSVRAAILCALAGAAQAAEPGLSVSDPWMRTIVLSRPAAGYFTLSNETAQTVTLVGAASPACGALMLHRSLNENGQERMLMVKSLAVPAHGEVKFAPGEYHLMCMSPSAELAPGHSIPVTLSFSDGGSLSVTFPVRGASGQ